MASKTRRRERGPWTAEERAVFVRLRGPGDIQSFLDALPYLPEGGALSPRATLRRGAAQCFGGAVFAAAALAELGHRPLLVDLTAVNDDDHVLAVFRHGRLWGAVGKSNFTTLRYREPVYRSLRELAMSYFDLYFNARGFKSLRGYSATLDLARYDRFGWRTSDERLWEVERDIELIRHYDLLPPGAARRLVLATPALLESSLMGSNPDGLYRPD